MKIYVHCSEAKGTGDGKNDESADNSSQSKLVSSISVSSCDIGKISLGFLVWCPSSGCFDTFKGMFYQRVINLLQCSLYNVRNRL